MRRSYMTRRDQPSSAAEGSGTAFDVFLSHAHEDAPIVERLAERLVDEAGVTVWLDKWVLVPGERWQQAMAKGLDQAKCCAVCVGQQRAEGWFQEEIERALNRQTTEPSFRVIPVLLPGARADLVDDFLELRTWVRFEVGIEDAGSFHALVSGVQGIPPGRPPMGPPTDLDRKVKEKLVRIRSLLGEDLIAPEIALEYQRKLVDDLMRD